MVTEMDALSERMVVDILRKDFPDYGVLGEEGSKSIEPYTCRWIIDPLDGTTNYSQLPIIRGLDSPGKEGRNHPGGCI